MEVLIVECQTCSSRAGKQDLTNAQTKAIPSGAGPKNPILLELPGQRSGWPWRAGRARYTEAGGRRQVRAPPGPASARRRHVQWRDLAENANGAPVGARYTEAGGWGQVRAPTGAALLLR